MKARGEAIARTAFWLAQPELLLIPLAFVLHFTWEMLQDPLYAGLSERAHGEVRMLCLMATLGDIVIALVAFYAAAQIARTRLWFIGAKRMPVVAWFCGGLLITIILELLAVQGNERWSYSPLMPVIPVLRIGLAPIVQWITLPAILLWLIDRHFRGMREARAR